MMNISINLQNHRITSDLVSNHDLSCCDVSVGEKRKRNEISESCGIGNCSVVLSGRGRFSDNGSGREEPGRGKQIREVDGSKEVLLNAVNTDEEGADVGSSSNLEVDENSNSGSEVAVQAKSTECVVSKFNDFDKVREEVNFEVGQTWAIYDTADGMPRQYALIRKVAAPCFRLRITYLEPDPDDSRELRWFEQDLPVSAGKFRLGKNENTKDRCKFSHIIQCNEGIDRFNTDFFTVLPRIGETWALFKDWDIKWSSEPDSHHEYEYEFVEVLSDYADIAGVFVAFLHKAKGFSSVFFRVGTGNADIICIKPHCLYRFSHRVPSFKLAGTEGKGLPKDAYELDQAALPEWEPEKVYQKTLTSWTKLRYPKAKGFSSVFFRVGTGNADIICIKPHCLYRFSHRVPSFKLAGTEGKGLPKDAYELDQAALPETIEEIKVPSNSEINTKSKSRAIYFASNGKVFQTGQIWSFYRHDDECPLYYGRIQKISFTQSYKQDPVFKLHITQLKATPFPHDVIQWIDKQMPITCGTFYARKVVEIITPYGIAHQMSPIISMDGEEYTIFPKIGNVWAIYRHWSNCIDVDDLEENWHYDVVQVLNDALNYEVLLLEPDPHFCKRGNPHFCKGKRFFRAVKEYKDNPADGSEPIFTIRKSEVFKFSHQIPASRVTKETYGDLVELYELDSKAVPINVLIEDDCM